MLTTDPSQSKWDRYGRLLAYVQVHRGARLNLAQISRGWAKVYVYRNKPFGQIRPFRRAQTRAKNAARGVWGRCGGDFHSAS